MIVSMANQTLKGGSAPPISTPLLLNLSALLSSCFALLPLLLAQGPAATPHLPAPPLLVAAAADLIPLEQPLCQRYEELTGQKVRFVPGASGMLARQIEQGAPFDLFLSADQNFVNELVTKGSLEPGSVRVYAVGQLALWSKSGSIRNVADLMRPSVLHVSIANPEHAPYGLAARQALENRGLWASLQAKIVYGENVRQTLQYAESGNADAAIVAWSLVWDRGGVLLPESWHAPIRQACGVVSTSSRKSEALRFLEFLTGPQGRAILEKHGLQAAK